MKRALLILIGLLAVTNARAANYTVTNTLNTGAGSLRDAVTTANGTAADDTVSFNIPASDANCTASGVCTISLTTGALTINHVGTAGKLAITNATNAGSLLISGSNASRVFFLNNSADLTLNGVTITGGNSGGGSGGGIFSTGNGAVTLINTVVSGNNATIGGSGYGGGIFVQGPGTLSLRNSSVVGNTGYIGGGVNSNGANVEILNSTITGNTGTYTTGALSFFNSGSSATVRITNSTVSNNQGNSAFGGIYFNSGSGFLRNTIVAGNTGGISADVFREQGAFTSLGNNLIGSSAGSNVTWLASDILNQPARLSPLGNYGGATPTQELLSGSPAINAGNNCVVDLSCATENPSVALPADQRGTARSGTVDIGAFEVSAAYVATLPTGNVNVAYNFSITPDKGAFTYTLSGGSLPNGIMLTTNPAPAVALTGTPTQSGTFNFAITATNGTSSFVTNYSLNVLAPTAASVTVGGRVTVGGNGLARARVSLSDSSGVMQYATTDLFGYYRFEDVAAGETFILSVSAKRYVFATQIITALDESNEINFAAEGYVRRKF